MVGHVPRKILCIYSFFIQRGGEIHCTVTNLRRYSADLAQEGMEISCTLTFKITDKHESEKSHKLINFIFKTVEGNLGNDNIVTFAVLEVKESSHSLCYDSNTICNSQNAETVDLSKCATDDLVIADDPPCKKIKLDFERIIMGEKLSDMDINAAQRVLNQQFLNIHGLESTLYQMKERRLNEDQVKDKIQIIHWLLRQHWIVATTVGCEANMVKVYDSMFHSVDHPTEKVIVNLFQCTDITNHQNREITKAKGLK